MPLSNYTLGAFFNLLNLRRMKKIVHTLLFCFLASTFFGQLISIEPEFIEANFENVDLNDNWTDLIVHFDIENISGEVINLKWEREVPEGSSCNFWDTQCCDNNQCYSSIVSSNVEPELGINAPSTMQVDESYEYAFHIQPRGIAGCCTMYIHFSTVENPDSILKTVEIHVKVNDPECLVPVEEPRVEILDIFPNPVINSLQLTYNTQVENLVIYNAIGHQVAQFEAKDQQKFDVSGLASGVYFVNLSGKDDVVLKTIRVVKQ